MLETPDQIQTPAVPDPPFLESATPNTSSQSAVPDVPPPDATPDETALTAEITELWRLHTDYAASMRDQSQNLRSLRAELAKKLAEMKQVLAQPGRLGKWSGWLKEKGIPRATADRLVAKYERSLHPDSNCLTEQITEPTEEEIQTLLDKVVPKLRRVLRTPASAYLFLDLMTSAFTLDRKDTEEGFVVLRPVNQTALVEPAPAEALGEPASLVA